MGWESAVLCVCVWEGGGGLERCVCGGGLERCVCVCARARVFVCAYVCACVLW